MLTFSNNYDHSIDAKGRTSVPAEYREAMPGVEKLVVTIGDSMSERRLVVYPPEAWKALEEALLAHNPFEPGIKQILRTTVAWATRIDIDKMGRILVPPKLREWAQLTDRVKWVGQLRHIEIWSPENWGSASDEALGPQHDDDRRLVYPRLR